MSPPTLSHSLSFTWALSHTHTLSLIFPHSLISSQTHSVSISTAEGDKDASAILAIFTLQKTRGRAKYRQSLCLLESHIECPLRGTWTSFPIRFSSLGKDPVPQLEGSDSPL